MEFLSAMTEGDFLKVTISSGSIKLPKASLADKTLRIFFPESMLPKPAEAKAVSSALDVQVSEKPSGSGAAAPQTKNQSAALFGESQDFGALSETLPARLPELPVLDKTKKFQADKVVFEIKSKMAGNEKVKIQALVPKDKEGDVPDSASDIVFYAPYVNYRDMHSKPTAQDTRIFWELCEVYGMTVFTAEFNIKVEDVDDRKKCYYYPEAGSFEVVFDAREKLISEFSLSLKKMYVIGNSGGSSMAQRMGLNYPDKIAAVAMLGGARFGEVTTKVDVPWLVLNTRGDPRAPQNAELANQLRAKGMNALYAQTQPNAKTKEDFLKQGKHFHHSAGDLGFDLMQQFILEISKMDASVRKNGWPLSASVDSPFEISEGAKNVTGKTIFFPSRTFAALWGNIPYRLMEISDPSEPEKKMSVIVRYPKGKVKKWVLLSKGTESSYISDGDQLDKLALDGYASVTLPFSKSERAAAAQAGDLVEWFCQNFAGKLGEITLLGFGSGGRHMAIVSATKNFSGMKHDLIVVDSDLYWPFKELNAAGHAGKISATEMFIVNELLKTDNAVFFGEVRQASGILVVSETNTLNSALNYL